MVTNDLIMPYCLSPRRGFSVRVVFVWLAVLLPALAAGCSRDDFSSAVARINGEPVSLEEFRAQAAFMGMGSAPSQLTPELRKAVLESLVRRHLVAAEAKRNGIRLTPEELEHEERLLRRGIDDKDFERFLAAQGLDYSQWRRVLAGELLARKTLDLLLTPQAEPGPAQVREYYLTHQEEFRHPQRILAQHVLLPDRKRAEKLLRLVAAGQDLAQAARVVGAASEEGLRPTWLSQGHMPPSLEKKIFALKPGKVAGPFKSDYGLHVIKVLDKEPAGYLTLAQAAPSIQRRLAARKKEALAAKWLARLRRQAKVEFNPRFLESGRIADSEG